MRTARRELLTLVVLLAATVALSGCGKKTWYWPFGKKTTEPQAAAVAPSGTQPTTQETSPAVPPVEPAPPVAAPGTVPAPATDTAGGIPQAAPVRKQGVTASELQMVHFEYDKADLTPEAKGILDKNAEWLLQHPGLKVQIEGHCDERGTVEYNLALGQRRADSVREYLVSKGIDPNSLITISYGKERPLSFGDTPQDHANNRRAQFLIFTE